MKLPVAWLTVVVVALTSVGSASAQQSGMSSEQRPVFSPQALSQVIQQLPPTPARPRPTHKKGSGGRRAVWTFLGAVGGAIGGLVLGAALEPDCTCDDPGMTGAVIGLPLGAIGGGVAGFVLSR